MNTPCCGKLSQITTILTQSKIGGRRCLNFPITYVPGTFTSMNSFYTGEAQKMSGWMMRHHSGDTVAFVFKDGMFPGESEPDGAVYVSRIAEANDLALAISAGQQLASFEHGLREDPLTGAGMPEGWKANPETSYSDYSYFDALQEARETETVWGGNVPRKDPAFMHGPYYAGPEKPDWWNSVSPPTHSWTTTTSSQQNFRSSTSHARSSSKKDHYCPA